MCLILNRKEVEARENILDRQAIMILPNRLVFPRGLFSCPDPRKILHSVVDSFRGSSSSLSQLRDVILLLSVVFLGSGLKIQPAFLHHKDTRYVLFPLQFITLQRITFRSLFSLEYIPLFGVRWGASLFCLQMASQFFSEILHSSISLSHWFFMALLLQIFFPLIYGSGSELFSWSLYL